MRNKKELIRHNKTIEIKGADFGDVQKTREKLNHRMSSSRCCDAICICEKCDPFHEVLLMSNTQSQPLFMLEDHIKRELSS